MYQKQLRDIVEAGFFYLSDFSLSSEDRARLFPAPQRESSRDECAIYTRRDFFFCFLSFVYFFVGRCCTVLLYLPFRTCFKQY